jgi:hypothetical protein
MSAGRTPRRSRSRSRTATRNSLHSSPDYSRLCSYVRQNVDVAGGYGHVLANVATTVRRAFHAER